LDWRWVAVLLGRGKVCSPRIPREAPARIQKALSSRTSSAPRLRGHRSPRFVSRQSWIPQTAFRREPPYRRSLRPTRVRSVGWTLRTLSATLHAVTSLLTLVSANGKVSCVTCVRSTARRKTRSSRRSRSRFGRYEASVSMLEVLERNWDDGTRTRDLLRARQEEVLVGNEALPS
jgi:hypothetical protein